MVRKLIIVAIVLFIAVGGYFIYNQKIANNQNIILHKDTGSVMHKTNGEYVSLDVDKKVIPNNSFVKTGNDGLAHVVLPNGSMISLAQNAEIQINYTPEKTQILQTIGNIWFRIKKIAGVGEFVVETSTAVATVRGTIFGIEVGDEDVIYVTESSVEVAQLKLEGDNKTKQNPQDLAENKLANITNSIQIVNIPDEKKQSPWFRRNEIISTLFTQGLPDDFVKKIHDNPDIQQIDLELDLSQVSQTLPEGEVNPFESFSDISWVQGGAESCAYINSQEYTEIVNQIRSLAALGGWGDWVIGAVDMARNACKDGAIDANEAQQLQKYYETAPQSTFGLPQM